MISYNSFKPKSKHSENPVNYNTHYPYEPRKNNPHQPVTLKVSHIIFRKIKFIAKSILKTTNLTLTTIPSILAKISNLSLKVAHPLSKKMSSSKTAVQLINSVSPITLGKSNVLKKQAI